MSSGNSRKRYKKKSKKSLGSTSSSSVLTSGSPGSSSSRINGTISSHNATGSRLKISDSLKMGDLHEDVIKITAKYLNLKERIVFERISRNFLWSSGHWFLKQKSIASSEDFITKSGQKSYPSVILRCPNIKSFEFNRTGFTPDDHQKDIRKSFGSRLGASCPVLQEFVSCELDILTSYLKVTGVNNQIRKLVLKLSPSERDVSSFTEDMRILSSNLLMVDELSYHFSSRFEPYFSDGFHNYDLDLDDESQDAFFPPEIEFMQSSLESFKILGRRPRVLDAWCFYSYFDAGSNLEILDAITLSNNQIKNLWIKHPNLRIIKSNIQLTSSNIRSLMKLENLQEISIDFIEYFDDEMQDENDLKNLFKSFISIRGPKLSKLRLEMVDVDFTSIWTKISSCCPNLIEFFITDYTFKQENQDELFETISKMKNLREVGLSQVVHSGFTYDQIKVMFDHLVDLQFFTYHPLDHPIILFDTSKDPPALINFLHDVIRYKIDHSNRMFVVNPVIHVTSHNNPDDQNDDV